MLIAIVRHGDTGLYFVANMRYCRLDHHHIRVERIIGAFNAEQLEEY
jgi:hypothetical protein